MAPSLLIAGLLATNAAAIRTPTKPVSVGKVFSVGDASSPLLGQHRLAQNASSSFVNANASGNSDSPACSCEHSNPAWTTPTRTNAKCIFIDLGAADGNTFNNFLNNHYGPVKDCAYGTGDYEAWLVEANPRFQPQLQSIMQSNPKVHALPATAAYMCEGQTSFYLDVQNHDHNYWGSSMGKNHPDAVKSGHQKVTVPTANLIKLIAENTIPDDYVIVKMDIEGAEWDIMPCLAEDSIVKRIDRLFLEQHPQEWSVTQPGNPAMPAAKQKMSAQGVDFPDYFSQTL